MDLLLIAVDLAMLTYMLGVLILALPIPYRPLKVWGPRLIADALMAAVLASSITLITSAGDMILGQLGVDWPTFYEWLSGRTAALVSVFASLTYASSLVKSTDYSFLASPLNMAAAYLATAFSSLKIIYLLSSFVYIFKDKLALIGILMYSIPFRLGKGVGSFMIAASIIMYVGFPLMPQFVATFESVSASQAAQWHSTTIYMRVTDSVGNPVPYPIVNFYLEGGNEEPIGTIIGDSEGELIIGDGLDALPENFTLITEVKFMGYIFTPHPNTVSSKDTSVTITIYPLLYSNGVSAILGLGTELIGANVSDFDISADINALRDTGLTIVALGGVNMSTILIDGAEVECDWQARTWYDITIKECVVSVGPGKHSFNVFFIGRDYPRPSVEEKRIMYLESVFDIITGLLTMAVSFLYSLVFLPGVYVAALTSVTAAASKVLGGGRLKLV